MKSIRIQFCAFVIAVMLIWVGVIVRDIIHTGWPRAIDVLDLTIAAWIGYGAARELGRLWKGEGA